MRGDWIKPGATVIDVGINRVPARRQSPYRWRRGFAEAVEVAGAITPVPGGVGPMTIACLLVNTLRAACMQAAAGAGGLVIGRTVGPGLITVDWGPLGSGALRSSG